LFGIVFSFHLESPVLFCQKIPLRVGIILGDGYQWTQWTVFSSFRVTCGRNGHCTTLWTDLPLNGAQGGSQMLLFNYESENNMFFSLNILNIIQT